MIIAVDKDRKIIEFNKAAEKTFGYRPEEILGRHNDILYVDPQEGLTINNVTHERGRFTGEILNRRKKGETFPSFLDSSVLRNARGEQVGVMGISRDISERKRVEKALKFTQFAIDRTGEAAYWMDSQAHFFYVNGTACRSLGYSREELLSMTVHDVDPGFPAETWPRTWEEVKKRRCFSFESHHRTKHGRIFPVEITVNYMEFEGKEYNCAFVRDITKRKQAEEERARPFEETKRNLEHISALHSVTAAASEPLHLDTVLQEAIKKITEIFHFDATRIFIFNPKMDELYLRASYETDPKFFAGVRVFRRRQGIVGTVANTGEALLFEDVLSDPRYQEVSHSKLSRKGKFSFFAAVPIKVKKGVIGVLVCVGKDPRRLKPDETRLITSIANQLAVAVENAMLYEQTKKQTLQLEKDIIEQKQAEEELKRSREQLRHLARHLQSVRETERSSIAREIHDELGQALTGLKINLIDQTIQTVRKISAELRPGALDELGLTAAIEWQFQEFQNRTGIKGAVSSHLEEIHSDQARSTAVFRIFQEALTNIARHAKATRVNISLQEEGGSMILQVTDNGRGIKESKIFDGKSLGLLGMRDGDLPLGGEVAIGGRRGEGTTVTVRIPLN